ncbi:hypothetical protein Q2T76_01340 [Lactobacillus sp. YT155]|uniref:DUF6560 family protein n=1 Tax=Lactobacillus sp. YT155 TaxID=3060955 RepID=UPI00265EB119|nr:DUF6560 family protein [Lactobacillus sp. YT155]MDO1604694.1 hypothetical protein [Lactobacillus sp. YT155]
MENWIQTTITTIIVVALLAYIQKLSKNENTRVSDQNFVVKTPNTYLSIFKWCAYIFAIILIIVYFYNGINFNNYNLVFLYIGAGVSALIGVINRLLSRWKIEINNDKIIYYSPFIKKDTTTFDNLDSVEITKQNSYILRANNKRFGVINSDFINKGTFLKRCKAENINIVSKKDS